MGYESRVYIVNEWDDAYSFVDEEIGKPLGEIIAKFDLCCVENGFIDVFKDEAKCYIYESNGESELVIVKDHYDKPLTSASIMDVYNNIEYGKYWRTTALKDYLHSLIVNRDILSRDFESLKVYHYGY